MPLLGLSRFIDAFNERVGKLAAWAIVAAVVVSSLNAIVRKVFGTSSNAWLELQWYLFSAVFLLAAGYTLLHNEHVRIDDVVGRFTPRVRAWKISLPKIRSSIWLSRLPTASTACDARPSQPAGRSSFRPPTRLNM